jgi:aldose 1-epimerase
LHIRNTGDTPLPYYAGHHFYFALPHDQRAQSRITLPATSRVRQLPDGSLTAAEPGERAYSISDPRSAGHLPRAERHRTRRIGNACAHHRFRARQRPVPWYAVTTWTERETSDFYCVEPWLGLPNAIHHGHGALGACGRAEHATCRVTVR